MLTKLSPRAFIISWLAYFDATSMMVTKMIVWVRLPNLPLPFWPTLEDIGNSLGKFIKEGCEKNQLGLFTYACIRLEIVQVVNGYQT